MASSPSTDPTELIETYFARCYGQDHDWTNEANGLIAFLGLSGYAIVPEVRLDD